MKYIPLWESLVFEADKAYEHIEFSEVTENIWMPLLALAMNLKRKYKA